MVDEITFSDESKEPQKEAVIIKASYKLKIKAGNGGFDWQNIAIAERRLKDSAHLFPEAASKDVDLIEKALQSLKTGRSSDEVISIIQASCIELKSHSVMFQFPHAAEVIDSLLKLSGEIRTMSPIIREVVVLHLRTLKIVIDQARNTSGAFSKEHLLEGLKKASEKALSEQ